MMKIHPDDLVAMTTRSALQCEQDTPVTLMGVKPDRLYGACSPQRNMGRSSTPNG